MGVVIPAVSVLIALASVISVMMASAKVTPARLAAGEDHSESEAVGDLARASQPPTCLSALEGHVSPVSSRPVRRPRRGVLVSAFASVVLAVGIAGFLIPRQSEPPVSGALPLPGFSSPEAPDATSAVDGEWAAEPAATAPPLLDPQDDFRPAYERVRLRLSAACEAPVPVDMDEPRVRTSEAAAEVSFIRHCGSSTTTLRLADGVAAAEAGTAPTSPLECADLVRLSPLPPEGFPVREGSQFCLVMSATVARTSGVPQKIVRMGVTAVAKSDLTVEATAWDVPG
jgi:hypothetical protein